MLSVIMQSVIMQSVVKQSVVKQSVSAKLAALSTVRLLKAFYYLFLPWFKDGTTTSRSNAIWRRAVKIYFLLSPETNSGTGIHNTPFSS
jgi:hypothetical protein